MFRAYPRLRPGPALCRESTGERCGPALAYCPRSGAIDQNPEDPRLERRSALEGPDALDHAQPRVLDDLLGDGVVRHVEARHATQARVMFADEPRERILVSAPERVEERRFLRAHGRSFLAALSLQRAGNLPCMQSA